MNIFDTAMAELNDIPVKNVWTDEILELISAARKKGVAWDDITTLVNKHFFKDNPVTESVLSSKWRRWFSEASE